MEEKLNKSRLFVAVVAAVEDRFPGSDELLKTNKNISRTVLEDISTIPDMHVDTQDC